MMHTLTALAIWQVLPEVVPEVQGATGWVDEWNERVVYAVLSLLAAVLSLVVRYIRNQLRERVGYEEQVKEAARKLSNPRDRNSTINGKTNSAELLNYFIDNTRSDVREIRNDMRDLRNKQDGILDRLDDCATKDDTRRIDAEIRDIRKLIHGQPGSGN